MAQAWDRSESKRQQRRRVVLSTSHYQHALILYPKMNEPPKATQPQREYTAQALAAYRVQLGLYSDLTLREMQAARVAKRGAQEDRMALMTIMRHMVRSTDGIRALLKSSAARRAQHWA
jgi:hypothetical protein